MHPDLFGIDNFSYLLMVGIGLIGAVLLFKHLCTVDKIDDKTYNFYSNIGILSIVAGFVSAVLFQAVYDLLSSPPRGIFITGDGGMTFMGGLVGGAATFILCTIFLAPKQAKVQFWRIVNIAAPSVAIAHCFGRIGCFLAGCCFGIETDSALGIVFHSHPEHAVLPTQLFEAIFLAILLLTMLKYRKHSMVIYLFAYSVFRFFIEFLRGDYRGGIEGGISPSQIQSLLMLAIAVAISVIIYHKRKIPFARLDATKTDSEVTNAK